MNPYAQFLNQTFQPPPPQTPPPPPDNPFARFLASILTVPSEVVNKTRGALDKFGAPSREALANLQDPATGRINPEAAKTLAMDFGGVTGTLAPAVSRSLSAAAKKDLVANIRSVLKQNNKEMVQSALQFPNTVAVSAKSPFLSPRPQDLFKPGSLVKEDFNLLEFLRSEFNDPRFNPIDPSVRTNQPFSLRAELPQHSVTRDILGNPYLTKDVSGLPHRPGVKINNALSAAESFENPYTYSGVIYSGRGGPVHTGVPLEKHPLGDGIIEDLNVLSKLKGQPYRFGKGLGSQINKNDNLLEALTRGYNGATPQEIMNVLGQYSSLVELPQYSSGENMMLLPALDVLNSPRWADLFSMSPMFALPAAMEAMKQKPDSTKTKRP